MSGEVEEVTEERSKNVLDTVVEVGISDPGMVCLADVDHHRGHRVQVLLEEDVHSIKDDLHDVSWLLDSLDLSDILLGNTLDGFLGTAQIGDSRIELLVGNVSLLLDLRALGFTPLGGLVDLLSLNVGLSVLLIKFLEELVGGLSGSVKFDVLFLKDELHCLDILSGLSKLEETSVNVLLFLVNCLELDSVKLIVGRDEGKVRLGGDVDVTSHLLEVLSTDSINHLMDFTHVYNELILDLVGGLDLEFGDELR